MICEVESALQGVGHSAQSWKVKVKTQNGDEQDGAGPLDSVKNWKLKKSSRQEEDGAENAGDSVCPGGSPTSCLQCLQHHLPECLYL